MRVFASTLDVFGKRRIIIISGFIWKKTADNMHRGFGVGFLQFFWTHEIKPLITLMQAFHACAARRCRSFQSRPAVAAALELPKSISKSKSNAKAAAKQARATRGQRRVARALASISVICGFLNQFSVPLLKHNLGAKPSICICRSFSKPEIYYISDFT